MLIVNETALYQRFFLTVARAGRIKCLEDHQQLFYTKQNMVAI